MITKRKMDTRRYPNNHRPNEEDKKDKIKVEPTIFYLIIVCYHLNSPPFRSWENVDEALSITHPAVRRKTFGWFAF